MNVEKVERAKWLTGTIRVPIATRTDTWHLFHIILQLSVRNVRFMDGRSIDLKVPKCYVLSEKRLGARRRLHCTGNRRVHGIPCLAVWNGKFERKWNRCMQTPPTCVPTSFERNFSIVILRARAHKKPRISETEQAIDVKLGATLVA